jgi:hypothetical protein
MRVCKPKVAAAKAYKSAKRYDANVSHFFARIVAPYFTVKVAAPNAAKLPQGSQAESILVWDSIHPH